MVALISITPQKRSGNLSIAAQGGQIKNKSRQLLADG